MKRYIRSKLREYLYCHNCVNQKSLKKCWDCIVNDRHYLYVGMRFPKWKEYLRAKLWSYVWEEKDGQSEV